MFTLPKSQRLLRKALACLKVPENNRDFGMKVGTVVLLRFALTDLWVYINKSLCPYACTVSDIHETERKKCRDFILGSEQIANHQL